MPLITSSGRFCRFSRPVVLIIALLVVGLCTACWPGKQAEFEPLPIDAYLQKPGDFLGNRYTLEAQINEQLRWENGLGRVLAVHAVGSSARLPVFVPEAVGENLHVGQRYEMQVIVELGGLIYVEALRKY
jgi:hypothetical protein